jgi:hypothetical protein
MSECKYCGKKIIGHAPEPHTCISCYNRRARSLLQSEQHSSNLASTLSVDTVECCACGKPMSILESDDLNFCNDCLKLKIECEKCGKKFVPIGSGNCPHCTSNANSLKESEHKINEKTNMGFKYLRENLSEDESSSSSRAHDKDSYSQDQVISPPTPKNKDSTPKSYKNLLKEPFSNNKSFSGSLNKKKKEKSVEKPSADYKFVKCRECGIEFVPREKYYHTCPRCFRNSYKKNLKSNDLSKIQRNKHKNQNLLNKNVPNQIKIKNTSNDLFNKIISSLESSVVRIILYCIKESDVSLTQEHLLQIIQGLKSDFIKNNHLDQLHSYSILPTITEKQFEHIIYSLLKKSFLIIEQSTDDYILITETGSNFLRDSNNIIFGLWNESTKIDAKNTDTVISDSINLPYRLLNDPKSANRAHIAYLLGESRDPKYVDVLCRSTKDPNGNVRRISALALTKIGEISAENSLIMLLEDPEPQVRQYAVRALGKINSRKV